MTPTTTRRCALATALLGLSLAATTATATTPAHAAVGIGCDHARHTRVRASHVHMTGQSWDDGMRPMGQAWDD